MRNRIIPDLQELLEKADQNTQRKITLAVSELAIKESEIDDPRLQKALELLQKERYGDSPERQAIKNLVDELDRAAWDIQGKWIEDSRILYDKEKYEKAFTKARAVNALWFALDEDSLSAVSETVYEANVAINDLEKLRSVIQKVLK